MMVSDHVNYLTFEDPGAVNMARRALKLAQAGDLYGAAEVAGVDVAVAAVVSEGIRRGMRFGFGTEVDNDPRSRPDAQHIVEAMRPDGIIRSVHFVTIEHPEKGADFAWPFDNPEFVTLFEHVGTERVWQLYMEKLLDDIDKLPGNIVGHFYVPAKFGHWPDQKTLEHYEDQVLDACANRGMAIELNTRIFYRDYPTEQREKHRAAYQRLIAKAQDKGVGIAIGSDAHSPKDQGSGFDIALEMLDQANINEIVFPINGRLARVALRATQEHLEAQEKRDQPAPLPGSSITGYGRAELGLPEPTEAELAAAAAARPARAVGAKKRTTGPTRVAKDATKESKASAKRASTSKKAGPAHEKPEPPATPESAPKVAPAKKAAAVKKPAPEKKPAAKAPPAPAKKVPVAKKTAPAKKAVVVKKVAPAKKAVVAKKPAAKAPVKKAAPPAKKTAPAKKAVPAKKAAPKKAVAVKKPVAKAPVKKAAAAKKAAPAKKAMPAKKAVPVKKAPAKKSKAPAKTKKKATPKRR